MTTLKQALKQQLKKGLQELIKKYSANAEQERQAYLIMLEILQEGF